MTDPSDPTIRNAGIRLLQLAVDRGMLTEQQFETVSTSAHNNVCDHAVEMNLLSSSDVDLLRPLAEADSFLPGYEFLDVVGVGATGAVYKARDCKLGRMVALKLLKPSVMQSDSATARSRIEAQIGASLQHPNVVVVHDYGVHHQRIFLAQEFIEGESVQDLIEREGALSQDRALDIVQQVVSALSEAAEADIVHRDIKPANLLLMDGENKLMSRRGPLVKVTDFGLAFQRMSDTDATRLTVDGATLGTPSYAAPEQLVDSNVDIRADIYSLGATLYHMVTGQQPFHGANAFQAIADKMSGKEDWRNEAVADLPQAIRALILDMTHHAIEDRIPCYVELSDRIQRVIDGADEPLPSLEPLPLPPVAVRSDSTSVVSVPRWKPALMVVLTVVLSVFAISALDRTPDLVPRQVESAGISTSLFNGEELPARIHRQAALGGSFGVATDSDGSGVLQGFGAALHFQIPPAGNEGADMFRFYARVELVGDTATADVCFAVSEQGSRYHALRLASSGARYGIGTDIDSEKSFMEFAGSPVIPLAELPEGPNYQVVVVEKHDHAWFVFINDELVGSCPVENGQLREVVIRANNGEVNFADLTTVGLETVAATEEASEST